MLSISSRLKFCHSVKSLLFVQRLKDKCCISDLADFFQWIGNTVKPVLETTCIKRPPALETTALIQQPYLNQPNRTCILRPLAVRDHFHYFP